MSLVGAGMGADADVVEHRKIGKQRDVLEGAADADFGDPVRRARQDALAFHQDVAGARLIEPGEAVESVVLPAPFGPIRPRIAPLCMSKDTPFNAMMPPNTTLTSRTASRGALSLRELCLRHLVPPALIMEREDRAKIFAGHDEGYLIPSATRATFPPAFSFLFSSFFDCGPRRPAPPRCSLPSPQGEVQYR